MKPQWEVCGCLLQLGIRLRILCESSKIQNGDKRRTKRCFIMIISQWNSGDPSRHVYGYEQQLKIKMHKRWRSYTSEVNKTSEINEAVFFVLNLLWKRVISSILVLRDAICRYKTLWVRIFKRTTFLLLKCCSIHVKLRVLETYSARNWVLNFKVVLTWSQIALHSGITH